MNKYEVCDSSGRKHKINADTFQSGANEQTWLYLDLDKVDKECVAVFHRPMYIKKIEDEGVTSDE